MPLCNESKSVLLNNLPPSTNWGIGEISNLQVRNGNVQHRHDLKLGTTLNIISFQITSSIESADITSQSNYSIKLYNCFQTTATTT